MSGSKSILGGPPAPSRHMAMAALCVAALAVSACGQKGPLYLPDPNAPVKAKPAAKPPAEAPR
ncbi:lipoprotein [Hydrogenophaga sp.]|uniref:LPS translocon maturation chaperone LptM n=1 Tax=Hydrogenophaga sp. TaxID=1904254 RepID=UPI002606D30D|nr:lipoprotein [Hydrogenophaga sp.]